MSIEIDPAFRNAGAKARARRRRQAMLRAGIGLGAVLGVALAGALTWLFWPTGDPTAPEEVQVAEEAADDALSADDDFTMVQTEGSAESGIVATAPSADAFLHLRKDPMILRLEQSEMSEANTLSGPLGLDQRRVGPARPDRLTLLTDDLVIEETRLVTTLPSTREDFASFQAQRSRGIAQLDEERRQAYGREIRGEVGEGELVSVDGEDGSWGSLIDTGLAGAPERDEAVYVETVIENTTTSAFITPESRRRPLYEDVVVVIRTERALEEVLTSNGVHEEDAPRIARATERILHVETTLAPGSFVALRFGPVPNDGPGTMVRHMTLHGPEGYLGTLAQTGLGRFAPSADPWIDDDLRVLAGDVLDEVTRTGEIRLLDAIYSAAIRNGLPPSLVGELIVMMAQHNDLDRFAAVGDQVTVLYGTEQQVDGQGPGRVLFAGVDGPSGTIDCYVTPVSEGTGFECFDFDGRGGTDGGLVIPVSGTKTSGFGPRFHPILKQMRNHDGVDWAAPTGTPVVAALPGRIEVAGPGGGYGNVIYVAHAGGLQTRYAHLDRYSDIGRQVGAQVQAGDVIGFVGTTGRSTGPHLHFELRQNGTPVDPLSWSGSVAGPGTYAAGDTPGSDAVEALVNQIIQVESAGNAAAKNPLSTATGLGQFIESTWIRMMQTYRPDLVASMSRAQLLNLRTDPALSREMVRNLARENEAFLRARGHAITPGRLYLAHFLGPAGAHTSLSAGPDLSVLAVMGAQVVNANPFLRGRTNGQMWAWADRKMGGASATTTVTYTQVRTIPPEVKEFKDLVDAILKRDGE